MRILGIGNALVDALMQLEDENLLKKLNLPKGAMTLIDQEQYKQLNDILKQSKVSYIAGGSVSNTIAGLAMLKIPAGFVGNVGDDYYGNIYNEALSSIGVISHLQKSDGHTGVATTFISKDGERTFGTYLGAAANINSSFISNDLLKNFDLLYIEGYLINNKTFVREIIEKAKEARLSIALDLASYNVVEENLSFLYEIIPRNINIIFANEQEAKALTQSDPKEATNKIAKWVDLAIVKVGKDGSWIQQGENLIHIESEKDIICIDSTGAGDLYAAGFLYGLTKDYPLDFCGRLGSILAGEVIQHIGPKIPEEKWDRIKQTINNESLLL